MTKEETLNRIESIIDSCKTYDQVQTCLSFVNYPRQHVGQAEKFKILGLVQQKAYDLRNADLKEHREWLAKK